MEDGSAIDFSKVIAIGKALFGEPIGEGRHRVVFRDGETVLKFPTKNSGIHANEQEARFKDDHLARADIDEEFTDKTGVPILRMEYVTHTGWSKEADWTWSIDCGQVGLTADGRLVAYDWDIY